VVQNPDVLTAHHAMWISDLQPVACGAEMALEPVKWLVLSLVTNDINVLN